MADNLQLQLAGLPGLLDIVGINLSKPGCRQVSAGGEAIEESFEAVEESRHGCSHPLGWKPAAYRETRRFPTRRNRLQYSEYAGESWVPAA